MTGQIAAHDVPAEPFYQAMLCPALLFVVLLMGVTAKGLPVLASIVGGGSILGRNFGCVGSPGVLWQVRQLGMWRLLFAVSTR